MNFFLRTLATAWHSCKQRQLSKGLTTFAAATCPGFWLLLLSVALMDARLLPRTWTGLKKFNLYIGFLYIYVLWLLNSLPAVLLALITSTQSLPLVPNCISLQSPPAAPLTKQSRVPRLVSCNCKSKRGSNCELLDDNIMQQAACHTATHLPTACSLSPSLSLFLYRCASAPHARVPPSVLQMKCQDNKSECQRHTTLRLVALCKMRNL